MWCDRRVTGASLPPRTLCFTFDDGPALARTGHSPTLELAHYLARQQIQAAFFLVGSHVETDRGCVARLRSFGHLVGNHSYDHPHLNASHICDSEAVRQILATSDILRASAGERECFPIAVRPPYGAWNPHLSHLMRLQQPHARSHVGPIHWDIRSHDYACWKSKRTPEACADAYYKSILGSKRQNGIMLFHDRSADDDEVSRRNRTPEMMRVLVPRLKNDGFQFAGLFEVPEIRQLLDSRV